MKKIHGFEISKVIKGSRSNENVWHRFFKKLRIVGIRLSSLKNTFAQIFLICSPQQRIGKHDYWFWRGRKQGISCFVTCQGHILRQECLTGGSGTGPSRTFSVFFLISFLSLPLTTAGILVSRILHHCLLCLWRENFIMGGNVPGWIRLVSWWTLCQGSKGSASQIFFPEQNSLCTSRKI